MTLSDGSNAGKKAATGGDSALPHAILHCRSLHLERWQTRGRKCQPPNLQGTVAGRMTKSDGGAATRYVSEVFSR